MARQFAVTQPASRGHRWQRVSPRLSLGSWAGVLPLIGVVALSLSLNAWALSGNGWGNTYYAAAARSMSLSWSNFFFGAFDPGGFITVDKPPVFLWIGALSVRVFGYSSWSVLLPSAVAGAATVGLLWLIVRRYFGVAAATASGAVLALTPITVAVDRLNLPEPFFILALVGAAGAVLCSLESRRWWAWITLAGVLVGLAFNTKMLAGWIPGPAFALALVAGQSTVSRLAVRRLLMSLALLAAVTFAVSASWMLVVDAWPSSDRPYIGGSTDNSVSNLILDYNGFGRVEGNQGPGRGAPAGAAQRPQAPGGANNGAPANGAPIGVPNGVPGAGAPNGAGGIIAGSPGIFRMFDAANGGQIAWFLPFALLGSILCAWEWRRDRVRRAATVLFLGWVLLFGLVFSYAQGIYHSYYTAALAPGVAALVGMSAAAGFSLVKRHALWMLPIAGITAATLAVQLATVSDFPDYYSQWRPVGVVVVALGGLLVLASVFPRVPFRHGVGLAVVLAGLLVMPGSWALSEATNGSLNTTLPQAGPRQGVAGRSFGSQAFDNGTASLATWLVSNRPEGAKWDLVVTSAQNASTLIAEYGLSVLPLGGFSGNDPTITPQQFALLVESGEVRYILPTNGNGGPGAAPGGQRPVQGVAPGSPGGAAGRPGAAGVVPGANPGGASRIAGGNGLPVQPGVTGGLAAPAVTTAVTGAGANAVMSAVRSACTAVPAAQLPAGYQGSVYDCAGAADRLRATR